MSWNAEVLISKNEYGLHVYCRTVGDTSDEALDGAKKVFEAFAERRGALVRVAPEVYSDIDFDTKNEQHRGYCRFTVTDKVSEHVSYKPENPGSMRFLPLATHQN